MISRIKTGSIALAFILLAACSSAESVPTDTPTTEPLPTAPETSTTEPEPTAIPTEEPFFLEEVEPGLYDLPDLESFQTLFNEAEGTSRLILLVSTGCPSCVGGARWLDEAVLQANSDLELSVFVVWFPTVPNNVLPSGTPEKWESALLQDDRVIHLWDKGRDVSNWFAENAEYPGPEPHVTLAQTFGGIRWGTSIYDTYFLYQPEGTWESADSLDGLISSGYPIFQHREEIRNALGLTLEGELAEGDGLLTYEIIPTESFVQYNAVETFNDTELNVAVGWTNAVSGTILFDPADLSTASISPITIDIKSFMSDNALRDERIQQQSLQSTRFPEAQFTPSAINGLPDAYEEGELLTFTIDGELVVREIAVPVTFDVTAIVENNLLRGTATADLLMTDFDFSPPSITNMIAVEPELQVIFEFVAGIVP